MERAVEVFALVNFLVIGLSHVLRPRAWVAFFSFLREQGEAGVFANAFLSLTFGSIVVAFHEVWTGLPLILTLVGWAQVLKALVYFTFPALGLRGLDRPREQRLPRHRREVLPWDPLRAAAGGDEPEDHQ